MSSFTVVLDVGQRFQPQIAAAARDDLVALLKGEPTSVDRAREAAAAAEAAAAGQDQAVDGGGGGEGDGEDGDGEAEAEKPLYVVPDTLLRVAALTVGDLGGSPSAKALASACEKLAKQAVSETEAVAEQHATDVQTYRDWVMAVEVHRKATAARDAEIEARRVAAELAAKGGAAPTTASVVKDESKEDGGGGGDDADGGDDAEPSKEQEEADEKAAADGDSKLEDGEEGEEGEGDADPNADLPIPEAPPAEPPVPGSLPVRVPGLADVMVMLAGYPDSVADCEKLLGVSPVPVQCVVELVSRYEAPASALAPETKEGGDDDEPAPAGGEEDADGDADATPAAPEEPPISISDALRSRSNVTADGPAIAQALWRDLIHVEIEIDLPNGSQKPPADIMAEIQSSLLSVAANYATFSDWLSRAQALDVTGPPLPVPPAGWEKGKAPKLKKGEEDSWPELETGLNRYAALLDQVDAAAVGVPLVTFALKEAVVAMVGEDEGFDAAYSPHIDWATSSLSTEQLMGSSAAADLGVKPSKRPYDNRSAAPVSSLDESLVRLTRTFLRSPSPVLSHHVEGIPIMAAERSVTTTLPLLVPGGPGRRAMPAPTMTEGRRGSMLAQFAHFTKLHRSVVRRTQELRRLEALVQQADYAAIVSDNNGKPMTVAQKLDAYKWHMHDWQLYEELAGTSLGQAFVAAMWNNPDTFQEYDELNDELVVAMHLPTPRVRKRLTKESILDVSQSIRPDFPVWRTWQDAFQHPDPQVPDLELPATTTGGDGSDAEDDEEGDESMAMDSPSKFDSTLTMESALSSKTKVGSSLGGPSSMEVDETKSVEEEEEPPTFLNVDYGYARSSGFMTNTLYPADHSVIRCVRTMNGETAWVTVYKDHHQFGLRQPTDPDTLVAQCWESVGQPRPGDGLDAQWTPADAAAGDKSKKGKGKNKKAPAPAPAPAPADGDGDGDGADADAAEPAPAAGDGEDGKEAGDGADGADGEGGDGGDGEEKKDDTPVEWALPGQGDDADDGTPPSQPSDWLFFASFSGDGQTTKQLPVPPSTLAVRAFSKAAGQKKGSGSVETTVTTAMGLIVENSSMGWVRQRRVGPAPKHSSSALTSASASASASPAPPGGGGPASVAEQVARVRSNPHSSPVASGADWPAASWAKEVMRQNVGPHATVVRHLGSGVKQVLYRDGAVSWWLPEGTSVPAMLRDAFPADAITVQEVVVQGIAGHPTRTSVTTTQSRWLFVSASGRVSSYTHEAVDGGDDGEEGEEAGPPPDPRTVEPTGFVQLPMHSSVDSVSGATVQVRYDISPVLVVPPPDARPTTSSPSEGAGATTAAAGAGATGAKFQAAAKKRARQLRAIITKHDNDRRMFDGSVWSGSASSFTCGDVELGVEFGTVTVVKYTNGDVLAVHADGTHMTTVAKPNRDVAGGFANPRVVVACHGFATVEVDVVTQANATRHAKGLRVASTASGMRTRSVTTLPDCTIIAADYDTRVTAPYHARLRLHRPDGVVVVVVEDGEVQYRPAGVASGPTVVGSGVGNPFAEPDEDGDDDSLRERDTPRTAREEEDVLVGVFSFKLQSGSLDMTDALRNKFHVDDARDAAVDIPGMMVLDPNDLSSAVIPKIAEPMEPRVFVFRGDGTGAEVLSPLRWANIHTTCMDVESSPLGVGSRLSFVPPESAGQLAVRPESGLLALAGGYGKGNQPVPAPSRALALRRHSLPLESLAMADAKAGSTDNAMPSFAHVVLTHFTSGGFDPRRAGSGGVGLLNRTGRMEVWGNAAGWIGRSRPTPASGGRAAGAGGSTTQPAHRSSTVSASGVPTLVLQGPRPPTGPSSSSSSSSLGGWAVVAVPELASRSGEAIGALRSGVAWRYFVEHSQLDPDGRDQLVADEDAYAKWQQSLAEQDDRFKCEDPRDVSTQEAALAVSKRALKIRKIQARKRKEKAAAEARQAAREADLKARKEERKRKKDSRMAALRRRAAKAEAEAEGSSMVSMSTVDLGANPGLAVPLPGQAPKLTVTYEEREAARAALRERQAAKQQAASATGSFWASQTAKSLAMGGAGGKEAEEADEADEEQEQEEVTDVGGHAESKSDTLSGRRGLGLSLRTDDGSVAVHGTDSLLSPAPGLAIKPLFRMTPSSAAFGLLAVGGVYTFSLTVANTGSDAPLVPSIANLYDSHMPSGNSVKAVPVAGGGIAPGSSGFLDVEIIARVVGPVHEVVEVNMGGHIALLPVTGDVVDPDMTSPDPAPGVTRLSAEEADAVVAEVGK